eukprot:GHVS01062427.1.p1 GENE.GHVS01062427.1~~GHVS01062427.1.p1  ORF type:complete len:266 (+),score=15.88 GHVS01062427.1:87-884(+)
MVPISFAARLLGAALLVSGVQSGLAAPGDDDPRPADVIGAIQKGGDVDLPYEKLLNSMSDKREGQPFTVNTTKNQKIRFLYKEEELTVEMTNDGKSSVVPFKVEAAHSQDNSVYVYLEPFDCNRALISFSGSEDGVYFDFDRFSLDHPQNRIFKELCSDYEREPYKSSLYKQIFEGFKVGKITYRFVMKNGDISVEYGKKDAVCYEVTGLVHTGCSDGAREFRIRFKRGDVRQSFLLERRDSGFKMVDPFTFKGTPCSGTATYYH